MKKMLSIFIFFTAALMPVLVFASGLPTGQWPREMFYHGKPLPVSCLYGVGDSSRLETRMLKVCTEKEHKVKKIKITDEAGFSNKDSVGYATEDFGSRSYTYYHYIGKIDNLLVVLANEYGGGSGNFTSLIGFERMGDSVRIVQEYAGGDRCNGGITGASIISGHLSYDAMLTPALLLDKITADSDRQNSSEPDDSAPACDMCCVGTANLDNDHVVSFGIRADYVDHHGVAIAPTIDANESCMNRLINSFIAGRKITNNIYTGEQEVRVSPDEISVLLPIYKKECKHFK